MHLFSQIKYMVTKTAGRISMVPRLWFQLKMLYSITQVLHVWFSCKWKQSPASCVLLMHNYNSIWQLLLSCTYMYLIPLQPMMLPCVVNTQTDYLGFNKWNVQTNTQKIRHKYIQIRQISATRSKYTVNILQSCLVFFLALCTIFFWSFHLISLTRFPSYSHSNT